MFSLLRKPSCASFLSDSVMYGSDRWQPIPCSVAGAAMPNDRTIARAATDRRLRFRALHGEGLFVMPNAWDVGSARLLASLGFPAIATGA